jgi:hypothetical protein
MKYNDKHSIKAHQKHVSKMENDDKPLHWGFGQDPDKWDRRTKREYERNSKKFNQEVYHHINREWWDSLSFNDRVSIHNDWGVTVRSPMGFKPINFGEWIKNAVKKYKPDISIYRDKVIDKLLNED